MAFPIIVPAIGVLMETFPVLMVYEIENPDVHIQGFLDYCFANEIRDPPTIVCIFPHTLHGKAAQWFNALLNKAI